MGIRKGHWASYGVKSHCRVAVVLGSLSEVRLVNSPPGGELEILPEAILEVGIREKK